MPPIELVARPGLDALTNNFYPTMEPSKYWIAPALVLGWGSTDLHPVIFNADRTQWIPATHADGASKFPVANWNMGRCLPGNRRKCSHHEVSYLAMSYANSRLMNVGQYQPVPAHVVSKLDKAFAQLN